MWAEVYIGLRSCEKKYKVLFACGWEWTVKDKINTKQLEWMLLKKRKKPWKPWFLGLFFLHSTGFEPAAFRSGAERSIPWAKSAQTAMYILHGLRWDVKRILCYFSWNLWKNLDFKQIDVLPLSLWMLEGIFTNTKMHFFSIIRDVFV